MSMGEQNLYYNALENIYCFMVITDSRLKKERGWKLWSIDDEPTIGPDEDDDDGFEADLKAQEEFDEYMDEEHWEYED